MQATQQEKGADENSACNRALDQIGSCLRRGCVICIEHTPVVAPRFTRWQLWGERCCFDGDPQQLYREIDRCRATHADHQIRLNIEDYSWRSRFSVVVHSPTVAT